MEAAVPSGSFSLAEKLLWILPLDAGPVLVIVSALFSF